MSRQKTQHSVYAMTATTRHGGNENETKLVLHRDYSYQQESPRKAQMQSLPT